MSIRKALLYAFSTRYLAIVLQFASSVILARLLSPAEVGIFSVGTAAIMIAQTLRDFGTSTYLIQEKDLTDIRIRTAFTITLIVAWLLAGTIWAASSPIAAFYAEPGVGGVLAVSSISFLLIPFGSVSLALIRRSMNFHAMMFITLAATTAHAVTGVGLAYYEHGPLSLAWAGVASTLTTIAGAWIAQPTGFFRVPSFTEWRRVLAFSLRSSTSSIASEAGLVAPDLVFGRTLGMEGTGLFSRAMGYVQLIEHLLQDVLRSVMLPYLAGQERTGGDVKTKLFLALDSIAAISFFAIGLIAILASPMIELLYGWQWISAVPVAQIICIGIAMRFLAPTLTAAIVARGHIDLVMRISVIGTIVKFALLIGSAMYGLLAGAIGFVVAEAVTVFLLLHFARRVDLLGWRAYASIVFLNLPATFIGIIPAVVLQLTVPQPKNFVSLTLYLAFAGTASLASWLAATWLLSRPLKHEILRLLSYINEKP